MGEVVKFKQNDIVWCIDPSDNGGKYCITSYHKKCLVMGYDFIGFLQVTPIDGRFAGRVYQVVEDFFELANRKAKVV